MQHLLSRVRSCIDDFNMIETGDKIAVGVSGGKDSLALLWALAQMRRFYPIPYELIAITLDMDSGKTDLSEIEKFCKVLDVEYLVENTDIRTIIFDVREEKNPCSLCSKMRKGGLNSLAKAHGCNKVALGHHLDDTVETFFMSLIFEGRISCFRPVTYLDRIDITTIRPMLYVEEPLLLDATGSLKLPVVENSCPANGYTKRQEIKELLANLSEKYPDIKDKIFGALRRSQLDGWNRER